SPTWRRRRPRRMTAAPPRLGPQAARLSERPAGRLFCLPVLTAEEAAAPAFPGGGCLQARSRVGGLVDLEALPVVGQPAGEKDLPGQEALPWFLMARLRLLHLGALLGGQLVAKRAADTTEQRDGRPLQVPPARLA